MPSVPIYNQQGEQTGTIELPPEVFGVTVKPAVLHQVVVATQANRRRAIAHTKTRGEVRGGGKKPWAQKHTGRARHGSIRSPLWVGGGTVFGPRADRNFAQKVNAKVRRLALRMALSDKVASTRLVVLDDLAPEGGKTKGAARALAAATAKAAAAKRAPSVLVVLPTDRRAVRRSVENLPRTTSMDAAHLNAVDVLQRDVVVATKAAVEQLRTR
jgi:large subunit ribosomal protein L4